MNLHTDFNVKTIKLLPDYEGQVSSTLISSKFNVGNRKSVLYLHGYIDYFFHPHMCEEFIKNGIDFYALDLRKYGRSLLEHQHPNYCLNMEEYFEEISIAMQHIHTSGGAPIFLMGHSTGGLLASIFMNDGKERSWVTKLILNSPFLEFNQPKITSKITQFAARAVSAFLPYSKIDGALSSVYPESVHRDYHGEWDFNLNWKPIEGFPTYFKWILAIARAQKRLLNSNIDVPVLVMHSSRSRKLSTFSEEAMSSDIVLNVEDIKRIGSQLGTHVTLLEIDDAQHDIFLSAKKVRDDAFKQMFAWLGVDESVAPR
jgi:alpha-beta hydrolase superfamily lysophospholipase